MQYIIRAFNKELGQIVVEYDNQWTFAVDLPIEDNSFPIGDKLEQVIQSYAPVWLKERKELLSQNPANTEAIEALVVPVPAPVVEQPVTTQPV